MRRLVALVGLAACLAGCPGALEIAQRERQWTAQNVLSYAYTLRIGCFCPPDVTRPVKVEVRGGAPVSLAYADDGTPASPQTFGRYDTVGELFALMREAVTRGGTVRATYDHALGYPRSASLDPIPGAVDDELSFQVDGLRRLED